MANDPVIAATGDTSFSGYLDPTLAQPYFDLAEKTSIIQRVAQKIPLGATGIKIPHWTGDVSAAWVGEGEQKPVTKGSLSKQTVSPHKIATIFVASAEVVRANPANYLNTMRVKVAEAIALAFDAAVLHGTNTPFGAYIDQTTKSISLVDPGGAGVATNNNSYQAINGGLSLLVADGKKWNGTLFDDTAEPVLNNAVDLNGRPFFIELAPPVDTNVPFREGRILGRPTTISDHVAAGATLGYMGDFTQIVWGQVGGLSFDVTDTASLDLSADQDGSNIVSLWQNNLVAVRVEAEYGVLVNDPTAFVKLTSTVTA